MSIGWEEVLGLVQGEMVGGEMIVTVGHMKKVSFGRFIAGQFTFSEAGFEFVQNFKAGEVHADEPVEEVVATLVEEAAVDHPADVVEDAAPVEIVAQPTLDDLLG